MVKKLSMCLTICILALCGCKDAGVKLEDENLIKVDITQPEQNLKMSDLFSSINYVKLETTEACLIKEINKIINYANAYSMFVEMRVLIRRKRP